MVEQESNTKAVWVECNCLHTHTYRGVQPSCTAWMLTNLPLKLKFGIFVGSNTETEISHSVLIQVWIFLRVLFGSLGFVSLVSTGVMHVCLQQEGSVGFTMEWEPPREPFSWCVCFYYKQCWGAGDTGLSFLTAFKKDACFSCQIFLCLCSFSISFFVYAAQQWLKLTLQVE